MSFQKWRQFVGGNCNEFKAIEFREAILEGSATKVYDDETEESVKLLTEDKR